jgi:hypothetical protein
MRICTAASLRVGCKQEHAGAHGCEGGKLMRDGELQKIGNTRVANCVTNRLCSGKDIK